MVDTDDVLAGRISVYDVMDVIREEADQLLGPTGLFETEDMFVPVLFSVRRRALLYEVCIAPHRSFCVVLTRRLI